jgi:hypothetical protein
MAVTISRIAKKYQYRVLSLGLFGLVTWRMTLYAHTMQESGEVSISLELPEYFVKMPIGPIF